jgi:hypothetical protein
MWQIGRKWLRGKESVKFHYRKQSRPEPSLPESAFEIAYPLGVQYTDLERVATGEALNFRIPRHTSRASLGNLPPAVSQAFDDGKGIYQQQERWLSTRHAIS